MEGRAQPYTNRYYRDLRDGARRSAEVIVPLVLQLVRPRSVIDIGCGLGTWLSVFREHGVEDVWGVDGDHVERAKLEVEAERFHAVDLREPLRMDREFDLVLSLEVAEHLPPECAKTFVGSLVGLGPLVLFSAAAPHQGGKHHINEQWPDYWAELFRKSNYVPVDCLRRKIWDNENVDWWYAQNILMFAEQEYLKGQPSLRSEYGFAGTSQLSIVHPKRYLEWIDWGLSAYEDA